MQTLKITVFDSNGFAAKEVKCMGVRFIIENEEFFIFKDGFVFNLTHLETGITIGFYKTVINAIKDASEKIKKQPEILESLRKILREYNVFLPVNK